MQEFDAIKIQSPLAPFSLVLQPQEFEQRLPSFRCQVACEIQHPTGRFCYEASNIWFGTASFDRFLSDLGSMTRGAQAGARLADLSDDFVFSLAGRDGKTSASLTVFRPFPVKAEARLAFSAIVDAGLPAAILAQLRDYDRWWLHRVA